MPDATREAEADRAHRRGLRFRQRDDYAVELFKDAQGALGDVARVDRILLALGRFYNPTLNAPIVDLATRRRVIEVLPRADVDESPAPPGRASPPLRPRRRVRRRRCALIPHCFTKGLARAATG